MARLHIHDNQVRPRRLGSGNLEKKNAGQQKLGSLFGSPLSRFAGKPLPGNGSQYLSIKYTERLAEAEINLSVATVGDAYDNALPNASSIRALTRPHWGHGHPQMFKTEVINQIGPWKSMREVEWETLKRP